MLFSDWFAIAVSSSRLTHLGALEVSQGCFGLQAEKVMQDYKLDEARVSRARKSERRFLIVSRVPVPACLVFGTCPGAGLVFFC